MFAERGVINPPLAYAPHLWAIVAICLVGVAVLAIVLWRLRREPIAEPALDVEALRAEALARLDEVMAAARDSAETDPAVSVAVAGRLGGEVRRFLGAVTGTDLDFSTSTQWRRAAVRDPRLVAPVQFLDGLDAVVFAPAAQVDVDAVHARAVHVVTGWR